MGNTTSKTFDHWQSNAAEDTKRYDKVKEGILRNQQLQRNLPTVV